MTERKKWMGKQRNVCVGDLVLIVDHETPRGQWPLGTVIKLLPTKSDQEVRKVEVKICTAKHVLVRPVAKLCLLATHEELIDSNPHAKLDQKANVKYIEPMYKFMQ